MKRSVARWLVFGVILISLSTASFGQVAVGISVRIGPPALPVYAQPICPGPGYLWTPGYWAWNDDAGYYWVPGTWVVAPVGMLWTPGYWGWGGGLYVWHAGYWGPHIGFYGGINYGFGYGGVGFVGGEWRGSAFYYNRSVTNVSVTSVTHVYNRTVVNNTSTTSFNGGTGGVQARPTAQEQAAEHERHQAPLASQAQHEHEASQNRQNFASENHGRPAVAATARPGDFSSHSAVPARASGGEYRAPAMSPKEARVASPAARNKGNAKAG
ncbi:MAG TPA: YXWGXW repeat-containing protein, partial [Terriglobales bacterium]|nr:YXWGXW repeat-containing protein [Terriglobales bacterium]